MSGGGSREKREDGVIRSNPNLHQYNIIDNQTVLLLQSFRGTGDV